MTSMSVSKQERAKRASKAIDGDAPVACGEYTAIDNGDSSNCIRAILAQEFCRYNDIQPGDPLKVWMHYQTGAMIILPDH